MRQADTRRRIKMQAHPSSLSLSGVDWNFPPLVRLHKKLSYLLHTPREHFEGAVILRYRFGSHHRLSTFKLHDFFCKNTCCCVLVSIPLQRLCPEVSLSRKRHDSTSNLTMNVSCGQSTCMTGVHTTDACMIGEERDMFHTTTGSMMLASSKASRE